VSGDFGSLYVGDVAQATAVVMPRVRNSVAPYWDTVVIGPIVAPASLAWFDIFSPGTNFVRARYDGTFSDFDVSASYSFDNVTVYAGAEATAPTSLTGIVGLTASFDQFDVAARVQSMPGFTGFGANAELTYNISEAFSMPGMVGGSSAMGIVNVCAALDCRINDYAKASVSYNNVTGNHIVSAGFEITLDGK